MNIQVDWVTFQSMPVLDEKPCKNLEETCKFLQVNHRNSSWICKRNSLHNDGKQKVEFISFFLPIEAVITACLGTSCLFFSFVFSFYHLFFSCLLVFAQESLNHFLCPLKAKTSNFMNLADEKKFKNNRNRVLDVHFN